MASNIDPTKPVTGTPTTVSVRDNFAFAKSEIEALQADKADAIDLADHMADDANPHLVTAAQTGAATVTMGTACTKNPYANNSTTTQAHGLGAAPTLVRAYLECLTAQYGYSIGDRLEIPLTAINGGGMGGTDTGITISSDATNCDIITGPNAPYIIRQDTHAVSQITAANWKVIAQPLKIV
jgi:hypothetical protein